MATSANEIMAYVLTRLTTSTGNAYPTNCGLKIGLNDFSALQDETGIRAVPAMRIYSTEEHAERIDNRSERRELTLAMEIICDGATASTMFNAIRNQIDTFVRNDRYLGNSVEWIGFKSGSLAAPDKEQQPRNSQISWVENYEVRYIASLAADTRLDPWVTAHVDSGGRTDVVELPQ